MPIYEYHCSSCLEEVEVLHSIDGAGPDRCERCGGHLERIWSSPSLNFGKHSSRTAERHTKLTVEEQARRERDRLIDHSKKTGIPVKDLFEDHH